MKPRIAFGITILTFLLLAVGLVGQLHDHLDEDERQAAVPARPDFGGTR